jgi:uncharacterized Zn-finger protein
LEFGYHRMDLANMESQVHCPYCITAYGFREMILKAGAEYVCPSCGHAALQGSHKFECTCARCRTLMIEVEKLAFSLRKVGIHLSK